MNGQFTRASLYAQGVSFAYKRPVVSDLSLALEPGTVTGIIGPNGSGKTTVLRLLCGILQPHSGEVVLRGRGPLDRLRRRDIARHIAMVPQSPAAYPSQTVLQFALQGRSPHLSLLGFESVTDEQVTREALEMTSLSGHIHARVEELSGGEKQRLLLARALAQQAEILLLDELTANLDINYQLDLMRLVRRLTRERSLSTLVVSHEIHLLTGFSDRVVLLAQGAVRSQGKVEDVVTRENLKKLFGVDFLVRPLPGRAPQVLPLMDEGRIQ